jgi:hypothetical protein
MKKMEGGDRREGRKEELEGVTLIGNRRREDKGRNKRMKPHKFTTVITLYSLFLPL